MDFSKLIDQLTAEMKKGTRYSTIPALFRIMIIIAMIPMIVFFIMIKLTYWITLFSYKMISAPAEYLHKWLYGQKDEVQHATQAVLYLVCMPTIFGLQVMLSLSAFVFFFLWFLLMVLGYIITLGAIKWQPFINEAKFEDDETEYNYKPGKVGVAIYAIVAVVIILAFIIVNISMTSATGYNYYQLMEFSSFLSTAYYFWMFVVTPLIFKKTPKN